VCSGSNDASDACEYYYYGTCAIRLGKFESGDATWTTDSRESVNKIFPLIFKDDQEKSCASQMQAAATFGSSQILLTKGSAEGDLSLYGTDDFSVDERTYTYTFA